jgi:integrase
MEAGKYISLGNSIQIRLSTKGFYTYYHSYRDNNKKVKRVKLFTSDKHTAKNFKDAIIQSSLPQETKPAIKPKKTINLNDLADKYFNSRYSIKLITLKQDYKHLAKGLTDEEFTQIKIIKQRLASLKIERQKYNKNVSKSNVAIIDVLDITKEEINNYIYKDLPTMNLSLKSNFHMINQIKTIFNYAIRNELINIANPFQNVKFKKPKAKKRKSLDIDELKLLLKTCKEYESNPNVYLAVYLGVITAARSKMILNIRKKDINLKTQEIKLSNFKSDKTYSIKLNKESIEWLDDKVLKHINYDDYLIRSTNLSYLPKTPQPLSEMPQKIYEIMDELFNSHLNKQNNQEREDVVNFHTIRRSVATNLALQGTSIYDIMVLLDHSSIKQTQDYLSLSNSSLSDETNKLFSNVFEPKKFILPDITF